MVDESLGAYLPRPAPLFRPSTIVLAKGSNRTASRQRFAVRICAAYPEAEVVEAFGVAHNRVDLGESDPLRLHDRGKQTLVLGEHRSAVRFSDEGGNACPNYWHFSPYGFCPYGCHYCYLAGTPGVWFSPSVKIFLNLEEILGEIDRTARQLGRPTAFYLGKLQDGLALEPVSGYARTMVPFFAGHPYAHTVILTKSAHVENLLDLEHGGRTILSWTVNAPDVVERFEKNTPSVIDRLDAMRRCARAGYPVRAVLMPIIPIADWQEIYGQFVATLLESVPLSRITLGSICSYPQAQRLMERKLGRENAISALLGRGLSRFSRSENGTVPFAATGRGAEGEGSRKSDDGRLRFGRSTREEVYRYLVECIRRQRPDLDIGLCLEDEAMFGTLGLRPSMGRCNCVL
jgi:DNA repair photolyase